MIVPRFRGRRPVGATTGGIAWHVDCEANRRGFFDADDHSHRRWRIVAVRRSSDPNAATLVIADRAPDRVTSGTLLSHRALTRRGDDASRSSDGS
jgi:hypothetical protein